MSIHRALGASGREPWVLALAVLLPLYLLKLIFQPKAVREDFTNPALLGFCGALPVGMFLVAGGVGPYAPFLGSALWWTGFVLLGALQVWALSRFLSGSIELAQVNAGWLIVLVGGIVAPGPGVALGHAEAARFVFGASATLAPLVMALLLYRAVLGAPLPAPLRPSWFILLVPPALIYANGMLLYPGSTLLENLFFASLVLTAALISSPDRLSNGPSGRRGGPSPSRSTRSPMPPRATRRTIPPRSGARCAPRHSRSRRSR